MSARRAQGFTLLEVMVAMAILAMAMVALSEIDAGAVAMHAYAKKLDVATILAKEKMLDVETQLDEKGLPAEGENIDPSDGTFEEEGFPSYSWKVDVIAPNTENLDPQKLIDTVMGGGGDGSSDGSSSGTSSGLPDPGAAGGGLASLLGGLTGLGSSSASSSDSSGAPTPTGASGIAGLAGSAMTGPAQMMITQISQMVREVHLTVYWKNGDVPQQFTVVEQIVSMGQTTNNAPAGQTTQKNALTNPNDR